MNYIEAFKLLNQYSKNLELVEYSDIIKAFRMIGHIPMPLAKVPVNTVIDRARANKSTKLFDSIEQLGYIKDKEVIEKYLTEYGRANKPHEVLFYGAIQTSQIDKPRLTAIAETSRLFQDPKGESLDGELFTVSRWRNNEELIVIEVVFAEGALRNNVDIRKSFDNQISMLEAVKGVDVEFHKDFLIFISEEFARQKKTHNDYKISTAYTEIGLSHPEACGITFPSVQTQYVGQNIVLQPSIVDKSLKPEACSTQILYKLNGNMTIANGGYFSKKVGDVIEWEKLPEKDITPKEVIIENLSKKARAN